MSTRHATDASSPADERHMSNLAFVERRALAGNLVAQKAMLYPDRRHREMLYWLQSVSLEAGGLKRLARQILTRFPERIGSPTMHGIGVEEGVEYPANAMELIEEELQLLAWERERAEEELREFLLENRGVNSTPGAEKYKALQAPRNSSTFLLEVCRRRADNLPAFLRDFCLNPERDLEIIEAQDYSAAALYFTGIYSALEYFKTIDEEANPFAVTTSVGALVNDTLDYALRTRGMVIIEGKEGSGKSFASQAWARRHAGEARYVSLSGITHKTGFFQKVAECIGLAVCQRKSFELQAKVEAFFSSTRLMLVIDEAHHAWPKAMRVQCAPEIVDWIDTALVNQGVPVGLITTPQFRVLKERVERQTGWNSGQFLHRVKRFKTLPIHPTEEDLWAVARNLLTMRWSQEDEAWIHTGARRAEEAAARAIVGYALTSNFPMAGVRDSVNEARDIARMDARDMVCLSDVKSAIMEHQAPSDAAMKQAFDAAPFRRSASDMPLSQPHPNKASKVRVSKRAGSSLVSPEAPEKSLQSTIQPPQRLSVSPPELDADREALSTGLCS